MNRRVVIGARLALIAGTLMLVSRADAGRRPATTATMSEPPALFSMQTDVEKGPYRSGIYDFKDLNLGTGLTECPQAGFEPEDLKPLDLRQIDKAEQVSDEGDDRRTNTEFSCFPQNETSIAVNPLYPRNLVGGANDYRLGWGTSGFYASTNNGKSWYTGIIPFPSLPSGDNLDGGGDPALVFDRAGIVYYVDINFNRTDDTNGVFTSRSTNGGFTWTRPCVAIGATDAAAVCGGPGDPRQPGDGVVVFQTDNNTLPDGSVVFHDKEYVAAGPRPTGVTPICFAPVSRAARACDPAVVGVDRIYVTWTVFEVSGASPIYLSFSDDQARSWSPRKAISGSAPFCAFGVLANACDGNQFSVPTVSPTTGHLYVAFENFNTPDENQYLLVRSVDGGATFEGPFFVTPVYDVNYPTAGVNRPDCTARGQQGGRRVLTNSCFRLNAAGNVVVDKRGGAHADDLYLVLADNRNGNRVSTNIDVFLFKSTDGGSTWVGPTRVNDDRSQLSGNRDCGRSGNPACAGVPAFGNDQWFPWVDISDRGDLNIVFHDRRLDSNSTASEWPGSRQRAGNYLAWFWGAQCEVTRADSRDCVAAEAAVIPQPTAPVDPGADPQPGQSQADFPFRNFAVSDTPSNMDYTFRAGIFMGDYNNVAVSGNQAWAFWTDARNGRSSRSQAGRNPACEQADVFIDGYNARNGGRGGRARNSDELFLVTPCPAQAVDKGKPHDDD